MYFFNCTCLCLSGYKPYIIKKTKFESDCQIIGSAQNESFHARKMKRTCFNPCRGLRGFRRSRPSALPSIAYRGFAVAPMTLRAPADILPTFDFPIPIPPSSREGDRPVGGGRSKQAVEGVRRRWKEFSGAGRRKKPRREEFPLGGVSFMPLGISPAGEHRRPRRTASPRWHSRPARRRRLHR